MSNPTPPVDFSDLSDADINTIYEIVVLASEKTHLAYGPALFDAYDEIVERYNVQNLDESQRYFRFIVRMVAKKGAVDHLATFEEMLADIGISINPIGEQAQQGGQGDNQREPADNRREQGRPLGEIEGEQQNGSGGGLVLSQAETLAGEDEATRSSIEDDKSEVRSTTRRENLPRARSVDTQERITDTDRGWVKAPRPRRAGSIASNTSLRVQRRRDLTSTFWNGDAYSADESGGTSPSRSRRFSSGVSGAAAPAVVDPRTFLPPGLFERSEEELDDSADAFQQTKATIAQRGILWAWTQKAAQLRAGRAQMKTIAENFDHRRLGRDVLVVWHRNLDERRLEKQWAENEAFYTAIEENATRERDRNLKWVAFTHWDQSAKDERQRTSLARRHVLRKKYFNAWTSVTAVNNLKVRQFVLRKFFAVWEQRMHGLEKHNVRAIAVHDNNSARKHYWIWFFAFSSKVAPEWHGLRRRRQFFLKWREIVRQMRARDQEVQDMRIRNVLRKSLAAWAAKAQAIKESDTAADKFREDGLVKQALVVWRRDAVLIPRAAQLVIRNDQKQLQSTFDTWKRQAQWSRQAAQVHDLRILRNALTAWNDGLRVRFLEGQIDIRVRAVAFYKVLITLRGRIAERNYNRKIASHCLGRLAARAQNRQRSIEGAEATFAAAQRSRDLRGALARLSAVLRHRQDLDAQAQAFRKRQVLFDPFTIWRTKNSDVQRMNNKARAANFYILTMNTFERWGKAAQEARRVRRHEAYYQTRRIVKMNLAREMLRRMQIQVAHVRGLDRFAEEFQDDQRLRKTVFMVHSWRDKAAAKVAQERQAEDMYSRKILAATMGKLVERKNALQEMEERARGFATDWQADWQADAASVCLRRMGKRVFQLKGQDQWAEGMRQKNWEKHVRNMLRWWLEQAVVSRRQQSGTDREGLGQRQDRFARSTRRRDPPLEVGDMSVFGNLGQLDLNLDFEFPETEARIPAFFDPETITTATPLPGYLRTPSKRSTARAKARERIAAIAVPTTIARNLPIRQQIPATAPSRQQTTVQQSQGGGSGVTPFERKLREQGYAQSSLRLGGRTPSRFGLGQGFGNSTSTGFRGETPGRLGASTSTRFEGETPGRMGSFVGFEDITEVSEPRE